MFQNFTAGARHCLLTLVMHQITIVYIAILFELPVVSSWPSQLFYGDKYLIDITIIVFGIFFLMALMMSYKYMSLEGWLKMLLESNPENGLGLLDIARLKKTSFFQPLNEVCSTDIEAILTNSKEIVQSNNRYKLSSEVMDANRSVRAITSVLWVVLLFVNCLIFYVSVAPTHTKHHVGNTVILLFSVVYYFAYLHKYADFFDTKNISKAA